MVMKYVVSLLVLLLMVAGCSMSIGTYEKGLWYDHDAKEYHPNGLGIKFDIVASRMVRPFSFSGNNPWEQPDCYWDIPIVFPFLSISIGEYGAYIGAKSFRNHKDRYWWLPSDADPNEPETVFTLSASSRRTRWE